MSCNRIHLASTGGTKTHGNERAQDTPTRRHITRGFLPKIQAIHLRWILVRFSLGKPSEIFSPLTPSEGYLFSSPHAYSDN